MSWFQYKISNELFSVSLMTVTKSLVRQTGAMATKNLHKAPKDVIFHCPLY